MTAVNGDVSHEQTDVDAVDGIAADDGERPTWGDVWQFFAESVDHDFPRVLSKTQWATMIAAHPEIGVRDCDEAKKLIQNAEGGPIVETFPGSHQYVVIGSQDDHV